MSGLIVPKMLTPIPSKNCNNSRQRWTKAHYPKNRREHGASVFQWTLCQGREWQGQHCFKTLPWRFTECAYFLHGLDCLMDKGKLIQAQHHQKQRIISTAPSSCPNPSNTYPDCGFRSTAWGTCSHDYNNYAQLLQLHLTSCNNHQSDLLWQFVTHC